MKKSLVLAALAAVLAAPAALAEGTASPAEPSVGSILLSALVTATPVVATALAGLVAAALVALTRKLTAQAGESKLAQVGARASMLAEAVVREVEVTVRPKLEAAAADGILTQAELQQLKAEALTQLKASLGSHGLAELQGVLKLTAGSVGTFLGGLIEAAVSKMQEGRPQPVLVNTLGPVEVGTSAPGAIGSAAALAQVTAVPQTPRG